MSPSSDRARGFDPGGPWVNRWIVRGTLTTTSPLHIGSGRSLDFIDACVERDASGRPVAPGSGLRGTLRARLLEACGDVRTLKDRVFALFGPEAEEGDDEGLRSGKVRFEDARARPPADGKPIPGIPPSATPHYDPARATYVVTSVALEADTGTASDRKLYTVEVVPAGTTFDVRLVASNVLDDEVGLLLWALDRFNDEGAPLTLGADAGRGFGRVRWRLEELSVIGPRATGAAPTGDGFSTARQAAWRDAVTRASQSPTGLEGVRGTSAIDDEAGLRDAAEAVLSGAHADEPLHLHLEYRWEALTPLLLREGTKRSERDDPRTSYVMSVGAGKRRGEHLRVAGPDRARDPDDAADLRGPALQAVLDGKGRPQARFEIPGSAMRGVLRSHLLQHELPNGDRALDRSTASPDASAAARSRLADLFGTTERRGRVEFSHAIPEGPHAGPMPGASIRYEDRSCPGPTGLLAPRLGVEVRGPVDRITGGAKVGGLHQVAAIDAGATFAGSVVVRRAAAEDIATLLAWKRAFGAGVLAVGGATSVGFGEGTLTVTGLRFVGARSGKTLGVATSADAARALANHPTLGALAGAAAALFVASPAAPQPASPATAALAAPKRPALPAVAAGGRYMNPYDFVRFPRVGAAGAYVAPRTAVAREWEAVGPLVSGTLTVEMVALQPLLVVGRTDPVPQGSNAFGRWRFTRDGRGPKVPGATIRGMLRAYVEARWNTWVSTYTSNAATPDEWMQAGAGGDTASNPYARLHDKRYGGFNSDTAWRDHSPNGGWKTRTPQAIPDPFVPAWAGTAGILHRPIDLASFLFGAVLRPEPGAAEAHRAEPSLRGRVRVSDCRLDEAQLTRDASVPDLHGNPFLGGPKPSKSTLFYFERGTVRARHTKTKDHVPLHVAQFEGGAFRGRKFYFHQDASRCVASYVGPATDPRNPWRLGAPAADVYARPVEALRVGDGGRFRLRLDRVPLRMVALLLRALEPTDAVRHKLGYAKPFGFGSVGFAAVDLVTDSAGVTLDALRALAAEMDAAQWAFACEPDAWRSVDRDLRYVLTYDAASVGSILFAYPPYGPKRSTDAERGFATPHQLDVLAPLDGPRPTTPDDVRRFATAPDGPKARRRKTALDLGYWQRQSPYFPLVCQRAQRQGESPTLERAIHPEYAAP